jgi:hypothetical protein
MTAEEYNAIWNEQEGVRRSAETAYKEAIEPFRLTRNQMQIEAERIQREAAKSFTESAPFKVGDVVRAEHCRGYNWNRKKEKCQITRIEIGYDRKSFKYHGVKTKKDGTFGTQEDRLDNVTAWEEPK